MKALDYFNPVSVFVYFTVCAGIAMFSMEPAILALSMLGSVALFVIRRDGVQKRTHIFSFILFLTLSLINPLFQHNGRTVLFVLNDNPITLEALLYGVAASTMVVSVLYWFRSFSQILTSDKLMYLFGLISPKLALIISMALRYVPLFKQQAQRTDMAQKALGKYKEDNAIDFLRMKLSVFSILVSWALENGIITADSMAARGYGTFKRSCFSPYRFRYRDAALIVSSLALGGAVAAAMALGRLEFGYYPEVSAISPDATRLFAIAAYACLALLPSAIEIGDALKWQYLRSKT